MIDGAADKATSRRRTRADATDRGSEAAAARRTRTTSTARVQRDLTAAPVIAHGCGWLELAHQCSTGGEVWLLGQRSTGSGSSLIVQTSNRLDGSPHAISAHRIGAVNVDLGKREAPPPRSHFGFEPEKDAVAASLGRSRVER